MEPKTVVIENYMSSASFERSLIQFTTQTGSSQRDVIFDLGSMKWFDPYALSLLLIWGAHLNSSKSRIYLKFPSLTLRATEKRWEEKHKEAALKKRAGAFAYLIQCGFTSALDQVGIAHESIEGKFAGMPPRSIHNSVSPFLFFSKYDGLNSFIAKLISEEQMRLFFQNAYEDYEVIKSGKIRDIIVRELGDNLFEHGKGLSAHLVMNETSPSEYESSTPWEDSFFKRIVGSRYLEIVISDKGPGIFKTLRQ